MLYASGQDRDANFQVLNGLWPFKAVKRITFTGIAQVETVTLTGSSGTANIAVAGGLTKLATFTSTLTATAAAFVVSHATAYLAVGIVVTSNGADIIFTATPAGVPFSAPTITNASGNLDGTVAHTTANDAVVNSVGDSAGSGNPATLFVVTGDVLAYVFGICKTTLQGASATLEVGVTGSTASLIAQTTATTIAVNEGWHDATSVLSEGFTPAIHPIGGGLDIIQTVATADVSYGVIDYYCFWRPLSSDGLVTGD